MKLNQYVGKRLREVLTEGKWVVGTNVVAQISNTSWREAIMKVSDFNTIADLTFHLGYYIIGVTQVLEGGSLDIRDAYSFDAPLIESQEDWNSRVIKFCTDAERFIQLVEAMDDDALRSDFVDEKYSSFYRNIDVLIEHTYYHLGQIVLIKKHIENQ